MILLSDAITGQAQGVDYDGAGGGDYSIPGGLTGTNSSEGATDYGGFVISEEAQRTRVGDNPDSTGGMDFSGTNSSKGGTD